MAEQTSTPGSTADTSMNGSSNNNKVLSAPKDKSCPFCQQPFTSSSLGRHLDLYIKAKNPKPADGIHDVDEIRKLRGNITRRQPRNSISRREDSTPRGTPGLQDLRSPRPDADLQQRAREGSLRVDNAAMDSPSYGKLGFMVNKASWEATGVINNIPPAVNGDAGRSWEGEERDSARRTRSVSRQMLAKTSYEQKQKLNEAMDNARAAELALREILLAFRAAKQRFDGPKIFSYDPLTLSFPALVLHCLPPPPTIQQSTPIPSPDSWSLTPPFESQYRALTSHFSKQFQNWRNSCAIATIAPQDDLSYPPPQSDTPTNTLEDNAELAQRAEAEATELEAKISTHIDTAYTHWTALPAAQKTELWTLELARSIGRKSDQINSLERERDLIQQQAEHLRLQVDELSRLQQPREFRAVPPAIIPVDRKEMAMAVEVGLELQRSGKAVGWNLLSREVQIGEALESSIGRWRKVLRSARENGKGMAAQRAFSSGTVVEKVGEGQDESRTVDRDETMDLEQNHQEETQKEGQTPNLNHKLNPTNNVQASPTPSITSAEPTIPAPAPIAPPQPSTHSHSHSHTQPQPPPLPRTNTTTTNSSEDALGSDADADADMEEDDTYTDMTSGGVAVNGTGGSAGGQGMEGIEKHAVVNGYVRIGA